jgi:hypothetical protein
MCLAGEQDLHRPLARQQVGDAVGAVHQQVQALVGGQSPREADRQHVGIEAGSLGVLAGLVAAQPVGDAALPRPGGELGALLAADGPQLGAVDALDGLPRRRIVGAIEPPLAEVAIEQPAHRVAEPRGEVHAVGDVSDRHVVLRALGPQRRPHAARDLAVTAAHPVRRAAGPQRELGHAERLAAVVRTRAAQPDGFVELEAHADGQRPQRIGDLGRIVGVVAGRHRRVGGEDGARAGRGERVVERKAARELGARELQRGQRSVAFVEVHDAWLDAHRAQRAHAADAQQRVLGQAQVAPAGVQARGDPASDLAVLGPVGVQEIERHAAHVHAPDLRDDVLVTHRDDDGQRLAVLAGDQRRRLTLGIGLHPGLVLPSGGVDALAEVTLVVEQPDRDERQRAIGGLLEDVAGQRAQAAGVDRQRGVDAVLGAEEGHGPIGAGRAGRRRGACEVGADGLLHGLAASHEVGVGGGALQRAERRFGEQAHRVLAAQLPTPSVDRGVSGRRAGRPRPAQVVGGARQRRQRGRHARDKRGGGPVDVLVARSHGRG